MAQDEMIFANGFIFNRNENAPDFVIGRLSLNVADAIDFMQEHQKKGWVNIDVKLSKGGKYYMALDTFEPNGGDNKSDDQQQETTQEDTTDTGAPDDDLPF